MTRRFVIVAGIFLFAQILAANPLCSMPDSAADAALNRELAKDKNVTVEIDDCIVHLNGQVNRLSDAWDIEHQLRRHAWVAGVQSYLSVGGPVIEDGKLRATIAHELNWESNAEIWYPIAVGVKSGVVSLGGTVSNSMMLDSVLHTVASTKGVREIASSISVDPLLNIEDIVQWTPRSIIYETPYVGPMDPDLWSRRDK
jgi:osmotically-inducible protein OsmY